MLIHEYLEEVSLLEVVNFLFSQDVLDHAGNLDGLNQACPKILKQGGIMIYKSDLTWHGLLEDPVPSLDSQTYPNWLNTLTYTKYSQATRQLLSEYIHGAQKKSFEDIKVECLIKASAENTDPIWPLLRSQLNPSLKVRQPSWNLSYQHERNQRKKTSP